MAGVMFLLTELKVILLFMVPPLKQANQQFLMDDHMF
jgi:hypothetical protein